MASDREPARPSLRERLTWQRLGVAWAALAVLSGGGAGVLQWLGPPRDPVASQAQGGPAADVGPVAASGDGVRQGGTPQTAASQAGAPGTGASEAGVSGAGAPQAGSPLADVPFVAPHDLASTVVPAVNAPVPLHPSGGPDRREATSGTTGPAPGSAGETGVQASASRTAGAAPPAAATSGAVEPGAAVAPAGDGASAARAAPVAVAQEGPVVVAAPLAALLDPGPDGLLLPKVGADGLAPMQAYARPFAAAPGAKLVAVVLDGIGLSESDSLAAINALPGAVDLAVSPYAAHPDALLRQARLKGHELLASIPMEPAGSPLNDEGGRALTTDATPEANQASLERVLGRIQGYAGATGGSDGQRGEHFALSGRPFAEVARDLAARGLLYIDSAGARMPAEVVSRGVDLVVDEPEGAASLDARLARLEAMAQEGGAALGLAGPPRPVTVERIAAWAKGLASRGLVLAPASALARAGAPRVTGPASEPVTATSTAAVPLPGRPAGDASSRRAP